MRTLTRQEKRTIRVAGVFLFAYLFLFYGTRGWKRLEATRADYQKLVQNARKLKQDLRAYENKALLIDQLKEKFHIDPAKLSKTTLVAEASAALQKAAASGGVQLGPLRESSARSSAKELVTMQLESTGQVPGITAFLHRIETLGYPLIIDSLQINSEPRGPGKIKVNLTIVILDFEQWKTEEAHHA